MNGDDPVSTSDMLFHDEELDEEELSKCFKQLTPETIELIRIEYASD